MLRDVGRLVTVAFRSVLVSESKLVVFKRGRVLLVGIERMLLVVFVSMAETVPMKEGKLVVLKGTVAFVGSGRMPLIFTEVDRVAAVAVELMLPTRDDKTEEKPPEGERAALVVFRAVDRLALTVLNVLTLTVADGKDEVFNESALEMVVRIVVVTVARLTRVVTSSWSSTRIRRVWKYESVVPKYQIRPS